MPTAPALLRVDPQRAVALAAGPMCARFEPRRGLRCTSLTRGGEELLGPEGIPFLHPWANRLSDRLDGADLPRDEHGLPIHGVHPRAWRVEAQEPRTLLASLDFPAEPVFPYPHRVVQLVRLGESSLRIDTTLRAMGRGPAPVAFGFHPYLRVRPHELVALPERTRLLTDDRLLPTGELRPEPAQLAPLGDRAFDDGYLVAPGARFAIARRVEVAFLHGYEVAQIYAPPAGGVICFEPMTAPTNALVTGDRLRHVAPGHVFRAAFEIRV